MPDEQEYPDSFDEDPPAPDWKGDINTYLIRVHRYDQDDILMGTQYYVLVEDEHLDKHIITSVLKPSEPEADL